MLGSRFFWSTLLALLFGSVLTWYIWDWLRSGGSGTESNGTTVRNAGLIVGGVLAFIFTLWRSWLTEQQKVTAQRQADIAEQSLLNERYERGAEMLGSEVLSVRLGGVYALRRLAEEHPEQYHIQIMELFCAFVRHPTGNGERRHWPYPVNLNLSYSIQEDVQAVLTAIARRSEAGLKCEKTAGYRLDLRDADLEGAFLQGANLAGAVLRMSNLSHANLLDADLSGTNLLAANLHRAYLVRANLHDAGLHAANLSYAICHGIVLSNVNLDADLSYADLASADFSGAFVGVSDLTGAILRNANLSGADFGVEARSTPSTTLPFENTYTRLTQKQLDEARAKPDSPPSIAEGAADIETGEPLVWRGKPLDGYA